MQGLKGMATVLLALLAFAVRADTWLPPSVRHYPSATGDWGQAAAGAALVGLKMR